jgi:hypothetical protein
MTCCSSLSGHIVLDAALKVPLHLRLVFISSIQRKSYIDVINVGYIGETAHLDLLIGLHMKLIITLTFDTTPPSVALSCILVAIRSSLQVQLSDSTSERLFFLSSSFRDSQFTSTSLPATYQLFKLAAACFSTVKIIWDSFSLEYGSESPLYKQSPLSYLPALHIAFLHRTSRCGCKRTMVWNNCQNIYDILTAAEIQSSIT